MSNGAMGAVTYYYDAGSGTVKTEAAGIRGYGKSTSSKYNEQTGADSGVPVSADGVAGYVKVEIPENISDGVKVCWSNEGGTGGGTADEGNNNENSTQALISASAIDWSLTSGLRAITKGTTYLYNGKLFIAITSDTSDSPESQSSKAYFVQPNFSRILTDDDLEAYNEWTPKDHFSNIKAGDIYRNGNDLYVLNYDQTFQNTPLNGASTNWTKILTQ